MLTQLQTVKDRLKIANTNDDALLTAFISQASGLFAQYCNRIIERQDALATEFQADMTEIIPRNYPIEIVVGFDLKTNETQSWVPQTGADFIVRNDAVISLYTPLGSAKQQARAFVSGGYVPPGTTPDVGQTALPADLERACVEQIVDWYQNRNRRGLASMSGEHGSIQRTPHFELLPDTIASLRPYVRMQL